MTIRASYPVEKRTPVTDIATQEMYGLIGVAAADTGASRRDRGRHRAGHERVPVRAGAHRRPRHSTTCARTGSARTRSSASWHRPDRDPQPARPRHPLRRRAPTGRRSTPTSLLEIVEDGMSSEIYELMKRPDELYVVDRAHRRPRFVEDSVREMVRGALERFPTCPTTRSSTPTRRTSRPSTPTTSRPSAPGLVGEIRREMAGGRARRAPQTLRGWLDGGVPRA